MANFTGGHLGKPVQRKVCKIAADVNRVKLGAPDEDALMQAARGLTDLGVTRTSGPEFAELASVLSADYRRVPGLPSPQMTRHLAALVKTEIDPCRHEWRKWRQSANYRVTPRVFDSSEVAVYAAPYTRGAGLSLWGFSCDTRSGDQGVFVIFLNTAHQPGAVTATVAHELGHYIHSSLVGHDGGERGETRPMAPNFAAHLHDPRELYSDSLVALSAYGSEAAKRPSDAGRPGSLEDEIAHANRVIRPEYRIDFSSRRLPKVWRIRYLAATIHFFRLRRALLETAGV
jgi:hypothetical protein